MLYNTQQTDHRLYRTLDTTIVMIPMLGSWFSATNIIYTNNMVYIFLEFIMPLPRFEPGTPDHDLFVTNDKIRTIDELDRSAMGPDSLRG